jgi:hypothetical protein
MEIVDLVDLLSSKLVAILYVVPLYTGAGLNGQPRPLSYTEEVVGSSPISPTLEILNLLKPLVD